MNTSHWALVTGGSAGIGLAIARELLRREYRVILVSRSEERLQEARRRLLGETGRGEECIALRVADLTQAEAPAELLRWTTEMGYAVEVLVNNAGMYFFRDAVALPVEDVERIVSLNVRSVAMMCRLFGEQMAARGHGYILNLSSYSVYMRLPGWSLYSGSKAFVRNFSITFGREMRSRGVMVTTAAPAGVATELMGLPPKVFSLAKKTGFLMRPETCARRVVKALFKGREYIIPGWYNRLWIPLLSCIGRRTAVWFHRKTERWQK